MSQGSTGVPINQNIRIENSVSLEDPGIEGPQGPGELHGEAEAPGLEKP